MQVSNTRATVSAFYSAYTNRTNADASPGKSQDNSAKTGMDTVTISDAARQAAYSEEMLAHGSNPQSTAIKATGVEIYQVPSWYAFYGEEVSNTLGVGADWHAEKDSKISKASQADRSEFATLIDKHYQALLNKNNIKSTEDHYNAMILNRALSESLHKEMMASIKNDPKLADLAAKMGK